MSTRTFWRPGDGRSLRRDRVPLDLRVPGRMVPLEPTEIADTSEGWLPLADLQRALESVEGILREHVPTLDSPAWLSNGHYPEMVTLAFGGQRRELLTPGLYVVTDSGPQQRALYIGSSCEASVRSRLICHLYNRGGIARAQVAYRGLLESWAAYGYPTPQEADSKRLVNSS